jgi:hypothetical protein
VKRSIIRFVLLASGAALLILARAPGAIPTAYAIPLAVLTATAEPPTLTSTPVPTVTPGTRPTVPVPPSATNTLVPTNTQPPPTKPPKKHTDHSSSSPTPTLAPPTDGPPTETPPSLTPLADGTPPAGLSGGAPHARPPRGRLPTTGAADEPAGFSWPLALLGLAAIASSLLARNRYLESAKDTKGHER